MVILVLLAIVVGAASQRVTGMGLAMVAAPVLILLLDPLQAVVVVNACGAALAVVIGLRRRADIDWPRYRRLALPALVGVIPGTWLLVALERPVLETMLGLLIVVALTLSLAIRRTSAPRDGATLRTSAGFASGLMNSAAGVGGPAVTVYAVLSGWAQSSFAATMQPYLLTVAGASLASKVIVAPTGWPVFAWWIWVALGLALGAGLLLGELATRWITPQTARALVLVIAYVGAVAAVIKGIGGVVA